jgi:biotin carboxyl carrier protein
VIFKTILDGKELTFTMRANGENMHVITEDSTADIDVSRLSANEYSLLINGNSHYVGITEDSSIYKVTIDHNTIWVNLKDETELVLERIGMVDSSKQPHGEIRAPIPGLVSRIHVSKGDKIGLGDKLLILEAMKMENEIDSPVSGVVEEVAVSTGQSVEKETLLITIKPNGHEHR